MINHVANRDKMIEFVKEDLMGPQTRGIIVDLSGEDRHLLARGRVESLAGREPTLQQTLRRMNLFGQLPPHVQITDTVSDEELEALILGPLKESERVITPVDKLRKEFFGDLTPSLMPKRPGPFLYVSEYGTHEELITYGEPTELYVVGVLYPPKKSGNHDIPVTSDAGDEDYTSGIAEITKGSNIDQVVDTNQQNDDDAQDEVVYDITSNVMSISFFAFLSPDAKLKINVTGGFYQKETVSIHNAGADKEWWKRCPLDSSIVIDATDLVGSQSVYHKTLHKKDFQNLHTLGPDFVVDIYSRAHNMSGQVNEDRILTICLRNVSQAADGMTRFTDQFSLFQAFFSVTIFDEMNKDNLFIKPYPSAESRVMDDEEQSMDLLYQKAKTFAIGHNCSANWGLYDAPTAPATLITPDNIDVGSSHAVRWVCADSLPMYETATMTPSVLDAQGNPITVSMRSLAGLDSNSNGLQQVRVILDGYRDWIHRLHDELPHLHNHLGKAAQKHIHLCETALARMEEGFTLIQHDETVRQAFEWMNYAMLIQQLRGQRRGMRKASLDATQRVVFDSPIQPLSLNDSAAQARQWRPFQIAFLLLSIASTVNKLHHDRELVDLIWFPTGGGKTEAYLGLAAMSMLFRRLKNPTDVGTDVIMRYTMRLLSTQQFQRASGLICALEHVRRQNQNKLGIHAFTIGMYVGGESTPNNVDRAKSAIKNMQSDANAKNPFIIRQCPWCGAQMGPVTTSSRGRSRNKTSNLVLGYEVRGDDFVMRCGDQHCEFGGAHTLPIDVVDEMIYKRPPTFLIGTVDKFANVTRNEQMRYLFGLDDQGKRKNSPPNLIIQDELHLISGPLGTTVGFFEVLFEWLWKDANNAKPKVISSTATIRQYSQQVLSLFGRTETRLFPPPGLYADDSYFATFARDKQGKRERGRLYLGVCANGKTSSLALQSRIYASLLAGVNQFKFHADTAEASDPWWTLLMYFNSLKDVGTATYLFQNTVPENLLAAFQRTRVYPRRIKNFTELTGRLSGEEIPEKLQALEQKYGADGQDAVDACLATNIIEVGVDIDRLALMTVYNQPKSTAQYIQATGRVGRRIGTPGLIVSILSPYRMRDRSHYEHFRSYHERLYAQVEPTSVTPFSPTMLMRGVHVLMLGVIKQLMPIASLQNNPPDVNQYMHIIDELKQEVIHRASVVDKDAESDINQMFSRRIAEWQNRQPREWVYNANSHFNATNALAYYAGTYIEEDLRDVLWLLPTSMRNVDASANLQIMI
jgi:hypothetical protein